MEHPHTPEMDPSHSLVYHIRVKGHLGREWTEWFGGLTITALDNGETLFTGLLVDQAALYGVLRTLRDLGLPLLSVNHLPPDGAETSDTKQYMEKSHDMEEKRN